MGNFIFIVLHVIAVLFGMVWLIVTIPAHLIYLAVKSSNRQAGGAAALDEAPSPSTHVRCPDCRELVRADARKCKHCGAALVPQPEPARPPGRSPQGERDLMIAGLIVVFLVVLVYAWLR